MAQGRTNPCAPEWTLDRVLAWAALHERWIVEGEDPCGHVFCLLRRAFQSGGLGCAVPEGIAECGFLGHSGIAPMPATPRAERLPPTGTVTFLFTDIEGSTRL